MTIYVATKRTLTGTLASAASSAGKVFKGKFNADFTGTLVGTFEIQRSFDDGVSWNTLSRDSAGNKASYAVTSPNAISLVLEEPEDGVQYRVTVTAYTSGILTYRLSNNA